MACFGTRRPEVRILPPRPTSSIIGNGRTDFEAKLKSCVFAVEQSHPMAERPNAAEISACNRWRNRLEFGFGSTFLCLGWSLRPGRYRSRPCLLRSSGWPVNAGPDTKEARSRSRFGKFNEVPSRCRSSSSNRVRWSGGQWPFLRRHFPKGPNSAPFPGYTASGIGFLSRSRDSCVTSSRCERTAEYP